MKLSSRPLVILRQCGLIRLGLLFATTGWLTADSVVMIGGDQTGFPSEVDNIVSISAGSHHAMAVRANGAVLAWGRGGDDGRLAIPPNLGPVTAVAAGKANGTESHSVAALADGTVVCWGGNSQGQCSVPDGLTGVIAVAAGSVHTVALKSDRTVVSWGGPEAMHAVIAGWTNIVRIDADASGTVGLKGDGTVVLCLVDGTAYTPAVENVTMVAMTDNTSLYGGYQLMLVQDDGTLIYWSLAPAWSPIVIPAGPVRIAAVAAGGRSEYLLMADHTVQIPGRTGILEHGLRLTAIAAGADYWLLQCVRSSPEISMVGEREIPILSQGLWFQDLLFVEGAQVPFTAAARIRLRNPTAAPVTVTEISCDSADFVLELPPLPIVLSPGSSVDIPVTVAVPTPGTRRANLEVTSSDPLFGTRQLPIFAHGYPPHPRPGSVLSLLNDAYLPMTWGSSELTDAVAVAAGTQHVLALRADGTVVGRGQELQMPTNLRPAVSIAAGDGISAAIHRDGTLTVWGRNLTSYARDIRTSYGVVAAAVGVRDTWPWIGITPELALKVDGTVAPLIRYVHTSPNESWLYPPGWSEEDASNVSQIAAGRLNVVLLKRDGSVHVIGYPAEPPEGLTDVTAIAAGGTSEDFGGIRYFHVALKDDGSVVSWGGRMAEVPNDLPEVVAMAAGGKKVLFLHADGTLTGFYLHRPPTAMEWKLPPGLRDVSAISVGGYYALAIAPPMADWFTPFRAWMQERSFADWTEDPDRNGFNHWEDWVFTRDLGTHNILDALMIRDPSPPNEFFPAVRVVWRAEAPMPILQWSPDLRDWRELPPEIYSLGLSDLPPSGLYKMNEYRHSTSSTSRPPSSEYFRVLPP